MTPLIIILSVWLAAAVAVVAVLIVDAYRKEAAIERERRAWYEERRELLNRIQRPDHLPVAPRPEFLVPERELDEWNRVGQIVIDPEYGLDGN